MRCQRSNSCTFVATIIQQSYAMNNKCLYCHNKFLRKRMLRYDTTFQIEHELVLFFLGYISEYFARTRVWSGSFFIFVTNRGRLLKLQLPCSLLFPRRSLQRLCTVMFVCITEDPLVFNRRLLRSSLPSYLYSLFKSPNVKQQRFITKIKYESHWTQRARVIVPTMLH